MNKVNPHDPAFPGTWEEETEIGNRTYKEQMRAPGISVFEFFTAAAMNGFLASYTTGTIPDKEIVGRLSIQYAEQTIAELNNYYRKQQEKIKAEAEEVRRNWPLDFSVYASEDLPYEDTLMGDRYDVKFDDIEKQVQGVFMNSILRNKIAPDETIEEITMNEKKTAGTIKLSNGTTINFYLKFFD
jgi:hypothetical protein